MTRNCTCQCCLLNFNPGKLYNSNGHLLNNLPFCTHCREIYRSNWQGINVKCQEELKGIYENERREIERSDKCKNTWVIGPNYAKIIINYIENNFSCPNNYKISDFHNTCPFDSLIWQKKCQWCVFKKITPLTGKMSSFRYNVGSFKQDQDFWKQYFSFNCLVIKEIVRYFGLGVDKSKSTSNQTTSTSRASIAHLQENTEKFEISNQVYQVFIKFNQDEQNSTPYLQGIYENSTYLIKTFGKNLYINSKELISVNILSPSDDDKNNLDLINFFDSRTDKSIGLVDRDAVSKTLTGKIQEFVPLKITNSVHKFLKIILCITAWG